ncbi:MAG: hypothetical protein RL522_1463 [Pseudomonadota bacterium]
MNRVIWSLVGCAVFLAGCFSVRSYRAHEDRYLRPGALDMPLTGAYSTYNLKLLGRYRVTHEWINTSPCAYRAYERDPIPGMYRSNFWDVADVYEAAGKTWQGSNVGGRPKDFDVWVRSVKEVSQSVGQEGRVVEVGLKPLCLETWWTSSHYLLVRLRKASLEEVQREVVAGSGLSVQWTRRMLNGMEWQVVKVPPEQMETRRPNATGGLYETWITALGDTGYAIAFSLGASKESLDHPHAHAAFEAAFQHLVNSLKVEPL